MSNGRHPMDDRPGQPVEALPARAEADRGFEPAGVGQPSPSQQRRPTPAPRGASVVRYKAALRKAIRRNHRDPEIDFLNITAMLDLMTIILVFMLKSVGASSASIPQSKDLTLPRSVMQGEPSQEGVTVVISKSQILVGDDPTPVALLPGREQLTKKIGRAHV